MDTAQTIAMFVIAIALFIIVNKIFRVTYFGIKGFFFVFLCCMLVAAAIVTWLFSFVANHYGWLIGGVIVLLVLIAIGKRSSKSREDEPIEPIE
ncbi:hypothetical protein QWJ34_08030 [Saccharibacillus sp. CPCC 101409]|uniref:hypothetical protein n=1 Tax=Saccharibacillus sp. CPCC 101409 TaxID=3058041 RepID=UPI002672D93C|nr:hypothetical protein [Saccharibacillus sp. CPCC 101409]MDO3409710.1 hypothetical protein [Saccharibacillus sp. CPCC 101409]